MHKNKRRRWLLGLLTSAAAIIVVLRRRMQPIDSRPILPGPPPPPPSEPPRIVLPTAIITNADSVPQSAPPTLDSESETVAAEAESETETREVETEAPLLEREVGGAAAIPAIPLNVPSKTAQSQAIPDVAPARSSDGGSGSAPEADDDDDGDPLMSYCVSCRTKRPMINTHEETTENGRRALRGICEVCNSKMFRFLPNESSDRGSGAGEVRHS